MKIPSPLQMIILAHLDSIGNKKPSRYDVMIKINHIFESLDHPYSPGAFYHSVKRLADEKLIIINHESLAITPHGKTHLKESLLNSRLPKSFLGISYYIIALQLITDQETRRIGLRRIEVEMIKNNQNEETGPTSEPIHGAGREALKIWHKELSLTLRRIILELGA